MKKEFSIEAIKAGRAFGNERWGKAKRWVYLEESQYPLKVLFENLAEETYTDSGFEIQGKAYPNSDLYLLPEEKVWYENVYPFMNGGCIYDSLEEAKLGMAHGCIGHIRIIITGTDFKTEDIKLEK